MRLRISVKPSIMSSSRCFMTVTLPLWGDVSQNIRYETGMNDWGTAQRSHV